MAVSAGNLDALVNQEFTNNSIVKLTPNSDTLDSNLHLASLNATIGTQFIPDANVSFKVVSVNNATNQLVLAEYVFGSEFNRLTFDVDAFNATSILLAYAPPSRIDANSFLWSSPTTLNGVLFALGAGNLEASVGQSATYTVSGAYGGSTPTPTPTPTPSATQSTLNTAFAAVTRVDPASSVATNPTIALVDGTSVTNPLAAEAQGLPALAAQVDAHTITLAQAVATIGHYADATTSVATLSYEFFTGKTPSSAGYDYLVNSTANTNDLNDAYYAKFSAENRYINFSVNLGKFGAGATAFNATYGSLSLSAAATKAYTEIFGAAPVAGKIDTILTSLVPFNGTTGTRADYFAYYGQDGANGIGTKAAMVGWLLVEAVKADLGPYVQANDHLLADLAGGTANFNIDLLTAYGQTHQVPLIGA